MSRRQGLTPVVRVVAALFGLLLLSSAQAIPFCVTDVVSFKAAMNFGQFVTDSPLQIKLVQGTYLMDADIDYIFAAPTTIAGGYAPGCVSRIINPSNTIINIGLGHVFSWTQLEASPEALLDVSGLTFFNSSNRVYMRAGRTNIGINADDEGSIRLSNVRFSHISTTNEAPLTLTAFENEIAIENVLVDSVQSTTLCGMSLTVLDGATLNINHLTADLAAGEDICVESVIDASPHSVISNSIVWNSDGGNSQIKGNMPGGAIVLSNDLFNGVGISGATVVVENDLHVAPGWVSPATGDYHLKTSPMSPAINNASVVVGGGEPDRDIEGNARIIGSRPDRGAYESGVIDYTTLKVTNVLDSGSGSLRQAIIDSNSSPGIAKTIQFDIRTAGNAPICPAIIPLNTVLPAIASTVLIDGYSQPGSVSNSSPTGFNANLCVLIKSGGVSLSSGFRVLANAGAGASLRLRGVGLGGFLQPLVLLGGEQHLITGNQFGGSVGIVSLTGAALNAISIGVNASDSLIIGGINPADRNVIGGAGFNGIDVQSSVHSSIDKCQIVNNLIGLSPNDLSTLPNNIGINLNGSGCEIVGNRIAGNSVYNVAISGNNNVVQRNLIGINTQGGGVANNGVIGLQVSGSGNIIGAGGQGGSISANTMRFNNGGGVVVKGDAAFGNSLNANLIYGNGASFSAMDIDLSPTGATAVGVGIAALTANDVGDADIGPNALQNFPVGTSLVYTDLGSGAGMINRAAIITGMLDSLPGAHRIDAYYSSSPNPTGLQGRGYAETYLGNSNVLSPGGGVASFTMSIVIPTQLSSGVVSFTATDSSGNTSEIGTGLSIIAQIPDDVFKNSFE